MKYSTSTINKLGEISASIEIGQHKHNKFYIWYNITIRKGADLLWQRRKNITVRNLNKIQ